MASTSLAAEAYQRHVTQKVLPALAAIQGHRGARVLRREEDGGIEFLVMTFWDSIDAIRDFAGEDCERAVVEPEARALLNEYDERVRHYEVAR